MFGDTNMIGNIPFNLSLIIDSTIVFITSVYFTFTYLGWYGFIVLILTSFQLSLTYLRASRSNSLAQKKQKKNIERMSYINEAFQNIKGIKLYGWEEKLNNRIESLHDEE